MKKKLFEMYKSENIGQNSLCKLCRENSNVETKAQSPYLIRQERFDDNNICFVGKIARGDSFGEMVTEFFEDVSLFGHDYINNSPWAFFSYTREIIKNIYGDLNSGLKFVSFLNIIKCNDNSDSDTTDFTAKEFCIRKNKFIWKEIDIIAPKKLIFYTNTGYDGFIDEYQPVNSKTYKDIYDKHNIVSIRNKFMPWWERNFYNESGDEILRLLRVGHPERKAKEEFVELITSWLNKN